MSAERKRLKHGDLGWFDVFYSEAEAAAAFEAEVAAGNPLVKTWHAPNDSVVGECWPVWYGPTGGYATPKRCAECGLKLDGYVSAAVPGIPAETLCHHCDPNSPCNPFA